MHTDIIFYTERKTEGKKKTAMLTGVFFPQCSFTVLYIYWHGTKCLSITFEVQYSLLQIQNCAGNAPMYHHGHPFTVFGTATFQSNILHTLLLNIPVETPKATDTAQNRSSMGTAQYCILGSVCTLHNIYRQ